MTSHTDKQEEHRRIRLARLMQTTLYEKRVNYLLKFAYQVGYHLSINIIRMTKYYYG
jgi:hypothetical protein